MCRRVHKNYEIEAYSEECEMKYSRQIHTFGYIKTAEKQGKKEKPKNEAEIAEKNRIKEICLNCEQPKCGDRCRCFQKKLRNGD